MLRIMITLALFVGAGFVVAGSPANAAADWTEYVFAEDEFAVQFPVPPTTGSETYETSITEALPARTYSAEYDNILFKVRVFSIGDMIDQASNFVVEAAYNQMRQGNVLFNDFPRVGLSGNATFGITMTLDAEDGRRIRSSYFSENERVYLVEATVMPERGDLDQIVPSRFDQTLRLRLEARLNDTVPGLAR